MRTTRILAFTMSTVLAAPGSDRPTDIAAVVSRPVVTAVQSPVSGAEKPTNDSPIAETPMDDILKAVKAAKDRGAETAAGDIKGGKLRILYFGKPWSGGKPLVDESTGYRVQIVGGCVVSDSFVAEVDAYNRAMRDWHAKYKTQVAPKTAPPERPPVTTGNSQPLS